VVERMILMKYHAWYHVADLDRGPQARQELWLHIWERLESEGIGSQPDHPVAEDPVPQPPVTEARAAEAPIAEESLAEPRSA
jgi:hypothetical protein